MDNKQKFIDLLSSITMENSDIPGLIDKLATDGFFTQPATNNSFRNYEGGLCEHALARYEILKEMAQSYSKYHNASYSEDTIKIVGLLADVGKMDYFDPTVKNNKVYNELGKLRDDLGRYDWVPEKGYKVRDPKDRFIYGTLGQNSERIISYYIPLSNEEAASIIHLYSDYENPQFPLANIYFRYPLSVLLNCADKIASFIDTADTRLPF